MPIDLVFAESSLGGITLPALAFSTDASAARPLFLVKKERLADWLAAQDETMRDWVAAAGFKARVGEVIPLPGKEGLSGAVGGLGSGKDRARGRFLAAGLRGKLPEGVWRLECDLEGDELAEAALGWLLAGYRFDRFVSNAKPLAMLLAPAGVDAAMLERIASGETLVRDLINA
ncbi:MAG: leucyl aminopeptidase family protein, partial [Boseongicola sp. SB0676_bin_33]|nr:leucyl aminopeptidase family protein [Boseongicola sp. SB0676_bin_33]